MTHIFLTGEIQTGKSTVIKKTLSLMKLPYSGFCTSFGPDRASPDRCLYMQEASSPPVYDELHAVTRFRPGCSPVAYPDQFDALGVKYISEARQAGRLVIMDECGFLERDALLFQNEILETLKGTVPVLGVLRQNASGWTEQLRSHPNVRLMTVDEENRGELPVLLVAFYLQQLR